MLEHKNEKMERHISLMESERTRILWQSDRVGKKNLMQSFIAKKDSDTVELSYFGEKVCEKKSGQTNVNLMFP